MEASPGITLLVVGWAVAVTAVIVRLLRRPQRTVGLITFYLIIFTVTYWLAPALQLLPSYTPLQDPYYTRLGFVVSAIGLASFLFGALFTGILPRPNASSLAPSGAMIHLPQETVPLIYYGLGLISYFLLTPLFGQIPTLSAILSSTDRLLVVGAVLILSRNTTKQKTILRLVVWASLLIWPLVTVLNEGFLGFGLIVSGIALVTWVHLSGQKLKLYSYLLVILAAYFTLSVTESYFVARGEIRGLVWGGTAVDVRTGGVFDSLIKNFGWFGFGDPQRLSFVEGRLDLSNLTGIAVERLNSGKIDYANGDTLVQAGLMLVPRFLWPDKAVVVGGNTLISEYTGIDFPSGTSVATGQVMELYINFGLPGIIFGFAFLGFIIAALDQAAARAFTEGNDFRFALCFLPAIGLLLVIETMAAVVATTGAGVATALIVNVAIRERLFSKNKVLNQTVVLDRKALQNLQDLPLNE